MSRKDIDMNFDPADMEDIDNPISIIADIKSEEANEIIEGKRMPVLPLRNMILFPGAILPVTVGRKSSQKLIDAVKDTDIKIAVVCQKDPKTEEPGFKDVYTTGTTARVVRVLELPDNVTTAILQGIQKIEQ